MSRHLLSAAVLGALAAAASCRCRCDAPPAVPQAGARPAPPPPSPPSSSSDCQLVREGDGPAGAVPVRAELVVAGLEVPWALAFLPKGEGDAFLVTERPGRLRLVRDGALVPEPVATFPRARTDEGGLMGLALHPDFAENRLFYLYRTAETGTGTEGGGERRLENRVERFRLAADGRSAVKDRVILDGIRAARYHDGGRIRFGPDGMLYVATGDATEPNLSQDRASPNGKLLRVDPEGAPPPDNPFPGSPVLLLGLRNLEAFDFVGRRTLYLADHGPSGELGGRRGSDEVNVALAHGENFGWPTIWQCEQRPGMVAPSLTWKEAVPPGGAAIYTGTEIPQWKGSLLVATLGSRHLHRVVFDAGQPRRVSSHEVYFPGEPPTGLGRLREAIMGPDGALWLTTSNCDGRGRCPGDKDRVVRIRPAR